MAQKTLTHPKKSLGQYFITCPWVADEMIASAELSLTDTVLEIGPGRGALTKPLARAAGRVVAIEKDERLASELEHDLKKNNIQNVEIIPADVLTWVKTADLSKKKVIANIPYYLTSHLLRTILEHKKRPRSTTILIQKEVAERIVARPPDMNLLAISVQVFGKPTLGSVVPRVCFTPQPRVDSRILTIREISDSFFIENNISQAFFFKLIRAGFGKKRKMLINNIALGGTKTHHLQIFEKAGILPHARAEELSLGQWTALTQLLTPKKRL